MIFKSHKMQPLSDKGILQMNIQAVNEVFLVVFLIVVKNILHGYIFLQL